MSGNEKTVCVRCRVSGRVQGVFFRASTQRKASQLGLTGYARNLPDGSVEVLACGDAASVAVLKDWLREGPPPARVTALVCESVSVTPPGRFTTG